MDSFLFSILVIAVVVPSFTAQDVTHILRQFHRNEVFCQKQLNTRANVLKSIIVRGVDLDRDGKCVASCVLKEMNLFDVSELSDDSTKFRYRRLPNVIVLAQQCHREVPEDLDECETGGALMECMIKSYNRQVHEAQTDIERRSSHALNAERKE